MAIYYKTLKKMLNCTAGKKSFSEALENINYCNGTIYATDSYVLISIKDNYYNDKEKDGITYKIDETLIKGKSAKDIFEANENEFSGIVEKPISLDNIDYMLKLEDEYGAKIKYDKESNVKTGVNTDLLIKALQVFSAIGYSQPKIIDTGMKIHLIAGDEYITIHACVMKCKLA